ncbi:siderophore ABC transporter substrate-binding protein [Ponticoccus sp. (in: a-proteobacteria)]|uniref:siderophore ABC transporter substrate-binding protein n=1 Tax=Ponticoccus sp. (in: a-proteobacteria) TaxID=1925025 RepID=UPI003AB1F950
MRTRLLAGLAALTLAAPVLAQDLTVETATGPVQVGANPETLAVFDIAALDTLTALGVPVAGVPNPVYLSSLSEVAAQAQAVGTLFEPDFEALAVLQPDLIVVGGRSSEQLGPVSDIAPAIDMTLGGDDLPGQARARIAAYGALFGKEAEAESLTADLDAKVAEAKEAVAGKGSGLILLTNGGKISVYGAGSRFGWLHGEIGLPEAVDGLDAENHGQPVSFEFLAEHDPEWLLVIDRGAAIGAEGEAAAATLDNPLVAKTTAAREGQIVYLDAAPLYIAAGGAGAMMHTLDQIIAAFGASEG